MSKEPVVLVVEDEPLLGELITDALTERGFEVQVAHDARGALRYLREGGEADLLFTDIDLGSGMDGATLAQIVHEMLPDMPIVYSSGRRASGQFAAVPGAAFLSKPYTLNQIDAMLERLVRQ